jgi:hypothetical protein
MESSRDEGISDQTVGSDRIVEKSAMTFGRLCVSRYFGQMTFLFTFHCSHLFAVAGIDENDLNSWISSCQNLSLFLFLLLVCGVEKKVAKTQIERLKLAQSHKQFSCTV